MTERVLTDEEVKAAWAESAGGLFFGSRELAHFARAVEAGVLAKVPKHNAMLADIDRQYGVVTEREARKRERAAWDAAVEFLWPLCGGLSRSSPNARCNSLYPLPKITRPRTVTLSDGTKIVGGSIVMCGDAPFVYARTPADARLLADLVENPTEEVEE